MNIKTFLICIFAFSTDIYSQNPFLPPYAFIPDGEPHLFTVDGEERLFIYGSRDEQVTAYCGFGHDAWSAPADNLSEWTYHGEIFNVKQITDIGYGKVKGQSLFAPDCVYNPITKKYYLYVFLGKKYKLNGTEGPKKSDVDFASTYGDIGPNCFVATSEHPYGPFINPQICDWPCDHPNLTFDPSVIVVNQPDGSIRVWAFWGSNSKDCWAEIDPYDMHTIINAKTRKPDRNAVYKTLNNPEINNHLSLFEASSIKQVADNKFVFVFSPNKPHKSELTYCYSNSPEGPWHYGGPIINNNINWKGGNNHGSIVKVKDKWYIIYHRQAPNNYNRQAMIEPIELSIKNDSVIIPPVEMTSQGIHSEGLPYLNRYYAGIVCHIKGKAYVDGKQREKDGYNPIVVEQEGATLGFKYINFGKKEKMDNNIKFILNLKAENKFKLNIEVMPKNSSKRISLKETEISPKGKNKKQFKDYVIELDNSDNKKLKSAGGLYESMALFLTIKPTNENIEIKEFEFKK